jgi:uncharacterized protein
MHEQLNIFGQPLIPCCTENKTGFHRLGWCYLDKLDGGEHTVCAKMTDDFLLYSKQAGNNLSTPVVEFGFKGLVAGDYWCVCISRWVEAWQAGSAPLLKLDACHSSILDHLNLEQLQMYSEDAK